MRSVGVIAATFACSLSGCLDTKADMSASPVGGAAGGGAWDAGAGSLKPALAQPSAGRAAPAWAGRGTPPLGAAQPTAAGAQAHAGAPADAGARRVVPLVRAPMDAGAQEEPLPSEQPSSDDSAPQEHTSAPQPEASELPVPEHPGDLIITELMVDPKALSDSEGEWVELYNASAFTLELRDCELEDGAESSHAISTVQVEPGAFFTIAREPEPGFRADLVVPLSLTNSADSVAIVCQGREIDRVSYDKAAEFAIKSGVSLALDPEQLDALANDAASAWCEGKDAYATDLGSPGHANPSCHGGEASEPDEETEEAEKQHDAGAYDAGSADPHDAGVFDAGPTHYDAGESY